MYNIALLGCGRISKNHLRAIAMNYDRAALVAICDSNKDRIKTCLENLKEIKKDDLTINTSPKLFEDYKTLINEIRDGK